MNLQKDSFESLKAGGPISPEKSIDWVKKNIVGNIRKHELDDERMKETNALDMMQNSSIIYHTESILEMQICLILAMLYLTDLWNIDKGYVNQPGKSQSMIFMYILMGEHLVSYCLGIFRDFDLKQNGEPNKYGIEFAPREQYLRIFEIIFDLAIFIWYAIYFISLPTE